MENQIVNENTAYAMNMFFGDLEEEEEKEEEEEEKEEEKEKEKKIVEYEYNMSSLDDFLKDIISNRALNIIGVNFVYLSKKEEMKSKNIQMENVFVYNDFLETFEYSSYKNDDECFSGFNEEGFYIFNDISHSFSVAVDERYILDMDSVSSYGEYYFSSCNDDYCGDKKYLYHKNDMQTDGRSCRIFAIENIVDMKNYMEESNLSLSDIIKDSITAMGHADLSEYKENDIIVPFCLVANMQNIPLLRDLRRRYENHEINIIGDGNEHENKKKEGLEPYDKITIDLTKVNHENEEKYWNSKINNDAINVVREIYEFIETYFSDFKNEDIDFYRKNQEKGVNLIKKIFEMREEKEVDKKEVDKKEVDKKEVDKKEVDKKEVDKKEVDKKEVDKKDILGFIKKQKEEDVGELAVDERGIIIPSLSNSQTAESNSSFTAENSYSYPKVNAGKKDDTKFIPK